MLSVSCFAFAETGLKKGNEYKYSTLSGYADVTCITNEGILKSMVRCESTNNYPSSSSRFIYSGDLDVSKVKIINLETLKSKTKTYHSDAEQTSKFNLLKKTFFKRPLLRVGANELKYILQDIDGKSLGEGRMSVNLTEEAKECKTIKMTSGDADDCSSNDICFRYYHESACAE